MCAGEACLSDGDRKDHSTVDNGGIYVLLDIAH